jgi:hypothetical protein
MIRRQPPYSPEETARLGDGIYEREIRAKVEPSHHGQVVAIDVDSGHYAIGGTVVEAAHHLRELFPNAQVWCVRVGYPVVHHFASPRLPERR